MPPCCVRLTVLLAAPLAFATGLFAAQDHSHHHAAAAQAPKGPDDICWSGDTRHCDAVAIASKSSTPMSKALLPSCLSLVFSDGFEPGGAGGGGGPARPWSDPATWGGSLPQAGQSVSIPSGRTVVLDIATPALGTLTVEGTLVAAHDRDLTLSADIIMVHGGSFRIGCASDRFERSATITLTGAPSNASPHGMGTKVLGAMSGGSIELFGRAVTSWTRLSANAGAGSNQISVVAASGWRVGDRIVVASGSTEPNEAEVRSISAINSNLVTLDAPLATARLGQLRSVDGRTLDMRTEVGLLSRNIVIRGDASSDSSRFGGHVMTMAGSQIRVDGVQFRRMGQFDRLGRYPFHWHLVGNAAGQFIRNSAVDGSFLRGIVVHATNNAEVSNNVVFDTLGHNYVIEDALAINNRLSGNLGIKTRIAFMTDPGLVPQNDDQASNFWIRAARNTVIGNVAAGAEANGFWYDHVFDGPTDFRANSAHSAAARADHVVFNRQAGMLVENASENSAVAPLIFDGNLFHRNNTGIWPTNEADGARQVHRNAILADHVAGFPLVSEAVGSQITFEDALFVGSSASAVPAQFVQHPVHVQYGAALELVRPAFANWGDSGMLGSNDIFVAWQADYTISGARFVNTTPTMANFSDGTVLYAVDDSYLPRGMYVDAQFPQLAGPGAVATTVRDQPALRFPVPVGHAFVRVRSANADALAPGSFLVRNDGLRFGADPFGLRLAYANALSYRFESRPAASNEFGIALDLVGGMRRAIAGPTQVEILFPLAQPPAGVFRPDPDPEGPDWLAPGPGNTVVAAATLVEYNANPTTRYFYDATARTLRFMASERYTVFRP